MRFSRVFDIAQEVTRIFLTFLFRRYILQDSKHIHVGVYAKTGMQGNEGG